MTPIDLKPIRACPKCGAPLAADALNGLCPNCLVLVTFDQESPDTVAVAAPPAPGPAVTQTTPRPLLASSIRYFGDYELLEEIARGGMGVVYKARQTSLNRIVAVKMILGGQLATDADVRRFRTEAEAAANLQHPNIVAIHETGEHEGRHYFSMDYVEGKNLAQELEGKPMPPAQAAALLKTLAEAVHFAHQRGTLHRDLKPQNVLIDTSGQPRITDFGLARRIERDGSLTQTGAVMGSPAYMSQEQAQGRNDLVGPQSDVYSLGAIFYQLLTGKPPFAASTPLETMRQVVETEPTRPSKSHPQTPLDLETICLKCLEKRPERRYHSARELAEELDRFLNQEPIVAKPANAWRKAWSWSLRNPWAIIGTAAMAGIILLGFAYGLWERVKYLEGITPSKFYDPGLVMVMLGCVGIPGFLFGRWLKGRRQRNLPVSNVQLALLAGAGLLLIAGGLCLDIIFIRVYVWERHFFDSPAGVVGACVAYPFLFCWVGGILIWQAIRRQQAHWSGFTTVEEEWLPRQALHYSTLAFVTATFANLVLFVSVAHLGIVTGIFDRVLNVVGPSRDGKILLLTCFALIALVVSTACWGYATRKVYKRPPFVSVFLGVLTIALFFAPPYSALPATFVLTSIIAGLVGGWVLVKWVKIRKEESPEPLRPLALGELFQWDRGALVIALVVVAIALGSHAALFFPEGVDAPLIFLFLFVTVLNALWPSFFLAVRSTTGKLREFFLSMLLGLTLLNFVVPIALLGLPMPEQSAAKSTLLLHWLASTLAGIAAGCALIYFAKIRPKAR